jgi:glycerol kinase
MLLGLTSQTTPQQIIYSAYEAVCYQTREILESLQKDCGTWPRLEKIIVGGELSENSFFLQLLADLCGITIGR